MRLLKELFGAIGMVGLELKRKKIKNLKKKNNKRK